MCPSHALFEVNQPIFLRGAEVAMVHYLLRCGGTDDKGDLHSSWMRVSQCYHLLGGYWLIAHEHLSMPGDMEGGKILFDLQP